MAKNQPPSPPYQAPKAWFSLFLPTALPWQSCNPSSRFWTRQWGLHQNHDHERDSTTCYDHLEEQREDRPSYPLSQFNKGGTRYNWRTQSHLAAHSDVCGYSSLVPRYEVLESRGKEYHRDMKGARHFPKYQWTCEPLFVLDSCHQDVGTQPRYIQEHLSFIGRLARKIVVGIVGEARRLKTKFGFYLISFFILFSFLFSSFISWLTKASKAYISRVVPNPNDIIIVQFYSFCSTCNFLL